MLSTQEIELLRSVQREQQRLTEPVHEGRLACLCGTRIYMRGFSELRQVASWLLEALHCSGVGLTNVDACQRGQTPLGDAWPRAQDYRNLSACRERLYSRKPYVASCTRFNASIHYEWKSLLFHEQYDSTFRHRVAAAAKANPSQPVLAILNAGPHHFSQFDDHTHSLHWSIDDAYAFPQKWFDSYYDGAARLFDAFAPRSLPDNVCVLWRTSNIGPRLVDASHHGSSKPRTSHHPSARNGLHDWLNRVATAMAHRAGMGVIDLSDLTANINPPVKV